MRTIRILLAAALFLVTTTWPRQARADVTISGVVGEISIIERVQIPQGGTQQVIRFKLTDVNQTSTCLNNVINQPAVGAGYAWFHNNANTSSYKEWYAALLYSKKGAPISITISNNTTNCQVTSITLP